MPRKPAKREGRLQIRVGTQEIELFAAAAERAELTVAEWARRELYAAARPTLAAKVSRALRERSIE